MRKPHAVVVHPFQRNERGAQINKRTPLRIGVVGAGFAGTALAAVLHKLSAEPLEIILCEKSGHFGAGPAYSTPFPRHLLNVRAQDMSAFEDEPVHFTAWLSANAGARVYFDHQIPIAEQFVPRCMYYQYLQSLLDDLRLDRAGKSKVIFESAEVVDIEQEVHQALLILHDQRKIAVDRVILALGNYPPVKFPFPIAPDVHCISNPWDYTAINQIAKNEPILIVGTGLSMIDAVSTLYHQQHQGMIYAVSRHGLLPLPHGEIKPIFSLDQVVFNQDIRSMAKRVRSLCRSHTEEGGDWRSVVNALRLHIPDIWKKISFKDKKRFLRHVLPYWNIHRHRVHTEIMDLLAQLSAQHKLRVFSGRVIAVQQGEASIALRHTHQVMKVSIHWLINCMGPALQMRPEHQPLLKALLTRELAVLDELELGFAVDPSSCALKDAAGNVSSVLYALGASTRGASWEIGAVPEIRKQVYTLARHLLAIK